MIIKLTQAHIIGTVLAYLIGVCLVPLVIAFSKKEGLVDVPNERKIHTTPISRIGGVAIWGSTMLTFLCLVFLSYYPYGSLLSGILLGSSLMFLLGFVDDVYNLDAKFKLFIQIAITTLVYLLGVQINTIPFFGGINLGLWSYPITVLWIVGISNALNFIDGVDGLAGSVVTVSALSIGIIAVAIAPPNPISALIGFILAGSMLAFLTYNFNPAKIFMGDSGALFSGFLLAAISITGIMKSATLAVVLPVIILAVPIIDITYSSFRRISQGHSPFVADSEHIHHKLLHAGFSQQVTVLILTSVAIFAGALAALTMGSIAARHYALAIIAFVSVTLILNFLKVLTKK
ncbi:MAG: undecaprenyl/decaprenyl-phosphate alpha-N-acetylglucosaminyl 1-phosphate transferase [Heliobacteriaceae bacterium]|jgi:UDP-GlcNAc:undecaprenyl-phosphate GlcNAc-1-phosphate transferase|nr:undecaprenyl/decaprenyl-phosphate alpha-N-acetylglucosaminyl 1-phosphate transferase [Heliobacteriaceae bacterium]